MVRTREITPAMLAGLMEEVVDLLVTLPDYRTLHADLILNLQSVLVLASTAVASDEDLTFSDEENR